MSRAQVTAERVAEIATNLSRSEYGAGPSAKAISDLLTALSCEQERADAADRQLVQWREWAQFVYGEGDPVEGTDDDLRFRVCAAHEHDKSELTAERDALKQERNKLRLAFDDALQQLAAVEAERSARMRRVLGGEEG